MALTCNIDSRGKRARLLSGILLLIGAAAVSLWDWTEGSRFVWALAGLLAVAGAFAVFEAWTGWCALRAIGIKTRI